MDEKIVNETLTDWISAGRNKKVRESRESLVKDCLEIIGRSYNSQPNEPEHITELMNSTPPISLEDIEHAIQCDNLFKQPTLPHYVVDDEDKETRLNSISVRVLKDKALHEIEKKLYNKLHKWFDRTVISAKAQKNLLKNLSIFVIKSNPNDKLFEDLAYIFDKRTMLSGKKTFNEALIEHYLERVEEDKKAGHEAYEIYDIWHQKYSKNYAQNPGQIMPLIKNSILKGVSPKDITQAIHILGKRSAPITSNSIQYALMEAKEIAKKKQDSGAHGTELEFDDDKFVDIDDSYRYQKSWRDQ